MASASPATVRMRGMRGSNECDVHVTGDVSMLVRVGVFAGVGRGVGAWQEYRRGK